MNKLYQIGIFAMCFLFIAAGNSSAGKPADDEGIFNGNNFPSGPHFNLILHGKKDDFNCSPETYQCLVEGELTKFSNDNCDDSCDADSTCVRVYGNVINMPYGNENGDPYQILMESGRKGPKGDPGLTELRVTDACAGFGGVEDQASIELPANPDGYAVYARITGKPGVDTGAAFSYPDFAYVEDENGNDLMVLGTVVGEEITKMTGEDIVVSREGVGGKNKATKLTSLFLWSGTVCYFDSVADDDFDYCLDYTVDPPENVCDVSYDLCCYDVDGDGYGDGDCDLMSNVGIDTDADGILDSCPDPYQLVTVDCRAYEDKWVFNIADFVGMLWDIVNNNSYNIQIRFYPLPLNTVTE